ncbi:hypothetical protein [Fibrisoma limi]|nr:hypothetical protein [Fibrisoma limi]
MKPDPTFLEHERLFNSVEVELVRRWAFSQVPAMFDQHEASVLKCFVKAWWNLYHESDCALNSKNRTIWQRSQELPAPPLDTTALLSALLRIRQLVVQEALLEYRPFEQYEESALGGLNVLIHYYTQAKPEV